MLSKKKKKNRLNEGYNAIVVISLKIVFEKEKRKIPPPPSIRMNIRQTFSTYQRILLLDYGILNVTASRLA